MDKYKMLWTLSHKYVQAAYELAALLAAGKSNNYGYYHRLIATALRCFQAALQEPLVPDDIRLKIMLLQARTMHLETMNWKQAECVLHAALNLANGRDTLIDYKFMAYVLLSQVLKDASPKAAAKALDDGLQNARLLKLYKWESIFLLYKGRSGLNVLQKLTHDAELLNYVAIVQNAPCTTTTQPFYVLRLCQQALGAFVEGDTAEAIRVLHELHNVLDNMPELTEPLEHVHGPSSQEIFAYACLLSGVVHIPDSCTIKAERFLAEGLRIVNNLRTDTSAEPLYLSEREVRLSRMDRLASYLLFYLCIALHIRSNHEGARQIEQQLNNLAENIRLDPFIGSGIYFLQGLSAHYAQDFATAIEAYAKVDQSHGDLYLQAQLCSQFIRKTHETLATPSEAQLRIALDLNQAIVSREILQSRTFLGTVISTSSKHLNNTFRVIALNLLSLQYLDANPTQSEKMALAANSLAKKEQNTDWIQVSTSTLSHLYTRQGMPAKAAAIKGG